MKVTIIGAGNMGGALIKGWAKAAAEGLDVELTITARTQATLDRFLQDYPNLHTSLDNAKAVVGADVVVLAVKPWLIGAVIEEIRQSLDLTRQIVVSVAANILTSDLRTMLHAPSADVVYAMPNIAAEFVQSMTFMAAAEGVTAEKTKLVERLFAAVGAVRVCEERLIAAGMMMAGCGIAYVMRFVRAMMEGGVEMGFYPKDAQQIAMQTMQGAVTLLEQTGLHPEVAIDKVTTPGGVTIKGLNELNHAGFNSAVIRCLKAGLK